MLGFYRLSQNLNFSVSPLFIPDCLDEYSRALLDMQNAELVFAEVTKHLNISWPCPLWSSRSVPKLTKLSFAVSTILGYLNMQPTFEAYYGATTPRWFWRKCITLYTLLKKVVEIVSLTWQNILTEYSCLFLASWNILFIYDFLLTIRNSENII